MKALTEAWHELVGLFIEDGSLALGIVGVIAAAVLAYALGLPSAVIGIVLLVGCLGVLAENTLRAGRS